jgi:hypothetical protein
MLPSPLTFTLTLTHAQTFARTQPHARVCSIANCALVCILLTGMYLRYTAISSTPIIMFCCAFVHVGVCVHVCMCACVHV